MNIPRLFAPPAFVCQLDATDFPIGVAMSAGDYALLLQAHDWEHERADDHAEWMRGRAEKRLLRKAQPNLDASARIWNSIAPIGHRIKGKT